MVCLSNSYKYGCFYIPLFLTIFIESFNVSCCLLANNCLLNDLSDGQEAIAVLLLQMLVCNILSLPLMAILTADVIANCFTRLTHVHLCAKLVAEWRV